jgi:hypothetical protein
VKRNDVTRAAALLLFLLPGCVSLGYMNKRVQDVEDRLTECQMNWQNEMRELDALKEDIREGKFEKTGYGIEWK